MRRVLSMVLLAAAAAAWVTPRAETAEPPGVGAAADTVDGIRQRGTLRVGVALFEPWTIRSEDGELTGFEVDVANRIAQDMGVTPKLQVYDWDKIIDALERGEIDLIAAGMAITPARALRVAFSAPYADSGVSIATHTESTRDIGGLAELDTATTRITTVSQTQAAELAATLFDEATIVRFTHPQEAEQQVVQGKAQVYVATLPEVRFLALRHPGEVDLPLTEPLIESKAGLAVRRGNQDLLNYLNAWVTARHADRWLATHHRHWFENLDWMQAGDGT